ncbi:MAG: DUF547 domain-containing protein [Psychroserpens sp.]|nr:DUF547 domain-containing protein [Psychroserpens sp.]
MIFITNGRFISDHYNWDDLLQKHVTESGNVDYIGFKKDETALNQYLLSLGDNPPEASWTDARRLVYWMNAYNAFTVKLILNNYPVNSIKDIKDPWNQRFIRIGEKWYTLNDLEHRIIRKMGEPRIHFALVCAAVSCPKLYNKAFKEVTLEEDLTKLTKEFLADSTKNVISKNNISLSRIFKWYGKDFKTKDQNLIDFLNQYSDIEIASNAKKSFQDYNWSLNE